METLNNKIGNQNLSSNEPKVLPEYVTEYLAQALEHAWFFGQRNTKIDFKDMAQVLKSDILGE